MQHLSTDQSVARDEDGRGLGGVADQYSASRRTSQFHGERVGRVSTWRGWAESRPGEGGGVAGSLLLLSKTLLAAWLISWLMSLLWRS